MKQKEGSVLVLQISFKGPHGVSNHKFKVRPVSMISCLLFFQPCSTAKAHAWSMQSWGLAKRVW